MSSTAESSVEPQLDILLSMVEQRDAETHARLVAFRQRVQRALDKGRLVAGHGADHWRAIGVLAVRMVPEKVFGQMSPAELALLAAASWAHDLREPDTDGHDWLTVEPARWELDAATAAMLRRLCELTGEDQLRWRRVPRWAYVGRHAVDVYRVAAVLYLADRLDLEHTDVPPPPAPVEGLDLERPRSWPHQRGLTVGLIDPREGLLRLDWVGEKRAWRREIEEHYMPAAQEAMRQVRDVLLGCLMPFREIELHDLHAKPSADLARAQELMSARQGSRRRPVKPFKPLDPFEEDEGHLLAARDEETIRVAGRALTAPLTVLTGELGVGKTSLVAAGVLPWLREHELEGAYARCLNDPSASLLEAVTARLGVEQFDGGLPEAVQALAAGCTPPVVLILDQCQELFTRLGSRTRLEFAHDLAGLLSMAGEPCHVLLVIQREYLPRLTELQPALPTVFHDVLELGRLTREQAHLVIRRALGRFQQRFDGLVLSHTCDDLATGAGILPVELQIVCEALHQQLEENERTVGYEIYRRIGPARKILDSLLENRLRPLRWRRHATARSILVNCVTAQRTKALVTAEECAVDVASDLETCRELLEELVELGLLRPLTSQGRRYYELRHEYLAQRLEPWISTVEQEAKDVDDLLHRELNNFEKFGMLLDPAELRLIHQYRRRLAFTPEELELVIRSAAQERLEVDYWFGRVNELSVSQQMVLAVDLLYSPEPDLRDSLKQMISRLDHQAVIPTLLGSLQEAEPEVRETAIEILRGIDSNLVQVLVKGDLAAQQQAAYALGQIGARSAVPTLVETARSGAEEVREQAVEALAEIDRSLSADLLLRSMRSGSPESRWNAAMALGRLGRDAATRERLRREAARADAPNEVIFAYARAAVEGHQNDEAERLLRNLERRAVPEGQQHRIEQAWRDLRRVRRQEERGVLSWPMYRGTPAGTAFSAASLNVPLELKWEFATGDRIYGSPAVVGGMVYAGSDDGRLYCLDAESGERRWDIKLAAALRSAPCVIDGRVYIGDAAGRVHAVTAAGGEAVWSRDLGIDAECSPRGTSEQLVAATDDGQVVSFSPADGRPLWRQQLDGGPVASPALGEGVVAAGSARSGLHLLDAATGELRWRWQVAGGLVGSPVLLSGLVVCGSGDGRAELLTLDGEMVWTNHLPGPVGSSAAVAHERIYLGSSDGTIVCFDLATGARVWEFGIDANVSASPTVSGNTVFVGSEAGHLFALQARTGEPVWSYRTGYSIYSTPAVADGRLFVALRYYNMCAFGEPLEVEDKSR